MLPLSAVELHSRLVARSLSPNSVLETTLSRLKALTELNMFVTVSAETARQQASLADSRYREGKHREERERGRSGRGSCERTFGVAMGQFAMRSSSQPARAEGGVCFILNEAYERASVATK